MLNIDRILQALFPTAARNFACPICKVPSTARTVLPRTSERNSLWCGDTLKRLGSIFYKQGSFGKPGVKLSMFQSQNGAKNSSNPPPGTRLNNPKEHSKQLGSTYKCRASSRSPTYITFRPVSTAFLFASTCESTSLAASFSELITSRRSWPSLGETCVMMDSASDSVPVTFRTFDVVFAATSRT